MNREDIIRMAIEAELNLFVNDLTEKQYIEVIERFATLVASAAVRETSAEYRLGWNDGQIAEREACANAMAYLVMTPTLTHGALVKLSDVVNAIRARGDNK